MVRRNLGLIFAGPCLFQKAPSSSLRADPKTHVKVTESGVANHQLFCPEYVSPIYSTSIAVGPKVLNVRLGTARQREELKPRAQYWCRSAQNWATVPIA